MKRGALLLAAILRALIACSKKETTITTEPPSRKGLSIVGGGFRTMGGRVVNGLARWDGTLWKECGLVLSDVPGVAALTVWDDALIIGGWLHVSGPDSINRVARWHD